MRNAEGFAPPELQVARVRARPVRARRVGPVLVLAALLAAAAVYVVPRGIEAQHILAIEDDPSAVASHLLDGNFDAALAQREIEAALAAKDPDLAQSFVDLSAQRQVALDPALIEQVNAAVADAGSARAVTESFALGLFTGEPNDMAGLAGTALGDLFVFGDIRDAVREVSRMASGQPVDEVVLGLSAIGLAITAGTYATLGAGAPARVGLSLAKAARKTGRLSADLTASISRMMRGVVDWGGLNKAIAGASIAQPQLAIRAARESVKVERAGGLMHLARDVGRVQSKAGTKAALDGLKIAGSPRQMARVAKLAEKEGSRTRAILKLVGGGALALTMFTFNTSLWLLGALFTLVAFVSSLKSATERGTQRFINYRKRRRLRRYEALTVRA
ncbi:MAG: hypothetical protein Q8M26_12140 [Pseudolabrys sp.]|nr:hypothetical protein [Pseudolabrys sp.]